MNKVRCKKIFVATDTEGNLGSSVNIVNKLRGLLELGSGKGLSSSPKLPDRLSYPYKLCCNEYCSYLPGNEAGDV